MYYEKTPLYYSKTLSKQYQCHIWLKLELKNITGSHKDRESQQIIYDCLKRKNTLLGCASSGNLGMSLAYFAWRENLSCHLWISPKIVPSVHQFLNAFSAYIHIFDKTLSELYEISTKALTEMEAYNANPSHCSAKLDGNARIAHEIHQQMERVDTVICPINNGSLFLGLDRGLADDVKLVGVYSYATIAHSICGFYEAEGYERLCHVLKKRHGFFLEAKESKLREANICLFKEGIFSEPSSSAVITALDTYQPQIDEHICCIISGSALKYSQTIKTLLL